MPSLFPRRHAPIALLCAAALAGGILALPAAPAHARTSFFVGVAPPLFYPPPVYYPPPTYYVQPPVVYPPPPVWHTPPAPPAYAPPSYAPSATGQSCYAGAYVCPMVNPTAAGATCWCPNNSGGRAYGHAN